MNMIVRNRDKQKSSGCCGVAIIKWKCLFHMRHRINNPTAHLLMQSSMSIVISNLSAL